MNNGIKMLPGENDCAACRACEFVCPQKCITYLKDEGFFVPIIDKAECIHCNRCIRVCPKMNQIGAGKPLNTFAAISFDDNLRERSSSGGIAEEIAAQCIRNGGVVYGAQMNSDRRVFHTRIDEVEALYRIRGSKYVRSDLSGIFQKVRDDLKNGVDVLFIGTPCQVSAIKNVFHLNDRLYTIDLICHGIVPGEFFKEYYTELENKISQKIDHCEFRGRAGYCLALYGEDEKLLYKGDLKNDPYFNGFYYGWLMSRNCFACEYASVNRVSDVTLGDFWGLGDNCLHTDLTKGVSLVFTNTEKGVLLFEGVSCKKEERSLEEAVRGNSALRECEKQGVISKWFLYHLRMHGFVRALNRCVIPMKVLTAYKNVKTKIRRTLNTVIN